MKWFSSSYHLCIVVSTRVIVSVSVLLKKSNPSSINEKRMYNSTIPSATHSFHRHIIKILISTGSVHSYNEEDINNNVKKYIILLLLLLLYFIACNNDISSAACS